jgi:hypothetical protein
MPGRIASASIIIAILMSTVQISIGQGQMRGGVSGTPAIAVTPAATGTPAFRGSELPGPGRSRPGHGFGRRAVLLPYPYFYTDYGHDFEQPPELQVVAAPAPVAPSAPPPPLESLLIEWQGDRFVRMTLSQKASASGQSAPDYSEKPALRPAGPGRKAAGQRPRDLPPAVLVFRDGRKQEVSSYTIVSGTIYSRADYWSSGSWTRKIEIADLDVPATLKLNQERGLKFILPDGPNQVVMRP